MVRLGQTTKAACGKALVAGDLATVAEGPGDKHRHHHRLAAAGGHLETEAREWTRPGSAGWS